MIHLWWFAVLDSYRPALTRSSFITEFHREYTEESQHHTLNRPYKSTIGITSIEKAGLILVDSWWLVDFLCLGYDNLNFKQPKQKQFIANTDGGKTVGNDNEEDVLTCFQGLRSTPVNMIDE